jgi:hypothetical protein
LKTEFAHVPITFFAQMRKASPREGSSPSRTTTNCPNFVAQPPRTDARFVFTGLENRCFLPESQERTFRWFDDHQPGRHALRELPGYSHLDVFMGKNAARDVFPLMLKELA